MLKYSIFEKISLVKNNLYVDNKKVGGCELITGETEDEDYLLPFEGTYLNVVGLYILNYFRGKGFSKIFVDKIIEYARSKGIKNIVLDAEKRNQIANNLYVRTGFKLYKTDEEYNHYFMKV